MKLIGISAVSRAGKDTLCKILSGLFHADGIKAQRFALADELKVDLAPFVQDKFGVDLFNVEGESKELIRPLMVAYGGAKRIESKGTYWTSKLDKRINESCAQVGIVTDARYTSSFSGYEKDEDVWLKERGALLIHVTRLVDGVPLAPPNDHEEQNDPILKSQADYHLVWSSLDDNSHMEDILKIYFDIKQKWNIS